MEREIKLLKEESKEQKISLKSENVIYITGIKPTGELIITENGTYDVTNYASVKVSISNNTGDVDTSPILDKAILGTMILQ